MWLLWTISSVWSCGCAVPGLGLGWASPVVYVRLQLHQVVDGLQHLARGA